jgi:PAS domain S-box-containing protein
MRHVVPEDRPVLQAAYAHAIETGALDAVEVRVRHPDESVHWIAPRGRVYYDGGGRPVRMAGVLSDVTARMGAARERKTAEVRLLDTTRRLDAILANTRMAVFLMDDRQHCVYANAAAEKLTGYSFAEMRGAALARRRPPQEARRQSLPARGAPDRPRLSRARADVGRGAVRRARRRLPPGRLTASPVLDEAGKSVGTVVEASNIAEEKARKEEFQRLNLELAAHVEQTVAEREAALAQLHEAQKLETIGQMTGGVAHDFNNLLTPIVSGLDLLRRHEDERSQRFIDGALQSADRAKMLVQRLLAFAHRQVLQPRPVDPATLVGSMRDLVERSLGPAIDVVVDVPADLPPVLVDPNQLELALLNPCVNARDAMNGGGTLTIAARAEDVAADASPGLAPGR